MKLTLDHLRRYAVSRSLFEPTTLGRAIRKLGFVQADPIRAPARAQDLMLRHRVAGYRAGELERRYPRLGLEEDFFVNYGFLPREHSDLMHPRVPRRGWTAKRRRQAQAMLEYVREHRIVHPRDVNAHFGHGTETNWFGGSSNATTRLLDEMHYRGLLRVARREGGIRLYAPREPGVLAREMPEAARMDALADLLIRKYAPLTARGLGRLMSMLIGGVPQWRTQRANALARATTRLAGAKVDGVQWYWPAEENPASRRWRPDDEVRLLTPFDPITFERHRFELLWGWAYRFEAYTPAPKRKLGYYALPLLWHDRVIGWGNAAVVNGELRCEFGYVGAEPLDAIYKRGLEAEVQRIRVFLGLAP